MWSWWFHSLELAPGVVAEGVKSVAQLEFEFNALRLPDLRGKSVLDMAAWDGYFSFAAERAGASRVVALDGYAWSVDWRAYHKDHVAAIEAGVRPPCPPSRGTRTPTTFRGGRFRRRAGDPGQPGRAGRGRLPDHGHPRAGPVRRRAVPWRPVPHGRPASVDAAGFGVTAWAAWAVIESQATEFAGLYDTPLCEFYPGAEELSERPDELVGPQRQGARGALLRRRLSRCRDPHVPARPTAAAYTAPGGVEDAARNRAAAGPGEYRAIAHARRRW